MTNFDPTLHELRGIQARFDEDNFSGADTPEGKRRHVYLHLGKLMGKFWGIEEQVDHGHTDTSVLDTEIIPDLLVYAAQLAELQGVDLAEVYQERLEFVAERNGTGIDSVQRVIQQ